VVKDFSCRQDQLLIASCVVPCAYQNHLKPLGSGDGNAADVQEVNNRGELIQCRVAVEAEACEQYLECHPIADMRKVGAVEIESKSALGSILWFVDPPEPRLAIDEASDEPCACQAVYPWILPRGPDPFPIPQGIKAPNPAFRFVGFIRGEKPLHGALQARQSILRLPVCLSSIEIGFDYFMERAT